MDAIRKSKIRLRINSFSAIIIPYFEGIVNGTITTLEAGSEGFGYDPIFLPEDHDKTFAEMPLDIKNQISHRGRATQKLVDYLKTK